MSIGTPIEMREFMSSGNSEKIKYFQNKPYQITESYNLTRPYGKMNFLPAYKIN